MFSMYWSVIFLLSTTQFLLTIPSMAEEGPSKEILRGETQVEAISTAPSDFSLVGVSGGLAPWTNLYKVKIDSLGNGTYWIMYPQDRGTGTYTLVDTFDLTQFQLDSLYTSILNHNFFDMDSLYNGNSSDGTFCELKVRASGSYNKVITMNIYLPAFDSLIREINQITPGNYDLKYNELNFPNLPNHPTGSFKDKLRESIKQTQVFVEACTIKVILWLEIYGPCANSNLFNDMESDIENVWNRGGNYFHIDSCPVVFNVIGHYNDDPTNLTPGYHQIYVPCDSSDTFISHVHNPLPLPNDSSSGTGCWADSAYPHTYAHEAGHLMGLGDQYVDSFFVDSSGDTVRWTPALNGHENDIMASLDGQPTQAAIESVVSINGGVSCPDSCCGVGVVDDDGGMNYENCIIYPLQELGYNYRTYTVPAGGTGPPLEDLLKHPVIIWITGDDYSSTLLEEDAINLIAYLEQGGRLFITGQDIGYDIWTAPTNPLTQDFYTNYLHASYIQNNIQIYSLFGAPASFLKDVPLFPIAGGDCADNQLYPSEIDPIEPAFPVLFYDTTSQMVEVQIQDYAYIPSNIVVPTGATVRWINQDGVSHTSTQDGGLWDTGEILPGNYADVPMNFPPGVYTYHCTFHPFMVGTVEVITAKGKRLRNPEYKHFKSSKPTTPSIGSAVSSGSGGIAVELPFGVDTSRVVYFSFGFEGIASADIRDTILARVLDWLMAGLTPTETYFTRGDANADTAVNVTDAVYIISHLFPYPVFPCLRTADTNLDSTVNTLDVSYFLDHLFPSPNLPPPDSCGINSADTLPCNSYPPCGAGTFGFNSVSTGNVKIAFGKAKQGNGYNLTPVYLITDVNVAGFQFKLQYHGNHKVLVRNKNCASENYDFYKSYVGENRIMVASIVSMVPSTNGKATESIRPGKYKVAELIVEGKEVPKFELYEAIFSNVYGQKIVTTKGAAVDKSVKQNPSVWSLKEPNPNPFIGKTFIEYSLPTSSRVEIVIYSSTGRLVKTLVKGRQSEGFKSLTWNADDEYGRKVGPGIYFVKMTAQGHNFVRKIVLLK